MFVFIVTFEPLSYFSYNSVEWSCQHEILPLNFISNDRHGYAHFESRNYDIWFMIIEILWSAINFYILKEIILHNVRSLLKVNLCQTLQRVWSIQTKYPENIFAWTVFKSISTSEIDVLCCCCLRSKEWIKTLYCFLENNFLGYIIIIMYIHIMQECYKSGQSFILKMSRKVGNNVSFHSSVDKLP